ncbi:hypothetical protein PoB_006407000, partial [Plakobranchus ocellatus]
FFVTSAFFGGRRLLRLRGDNSYTRLANNVLNQRQRRKFLLDNNSSRNISKQQDSSNRSSWAKDEATPLLESGKKIYESSRPLQTSRYHQSFMLSSSSNMSW